ncbi:putative ion-transport protein YfeO [Cellulomonas chitinilytica]|uniref:Ion-transport protein YfeO n=1 Tax=Cellulomonas chitinilytica TaxID=398759 RepID=A0A919U3G6_9CELL|nr:ion channel protein [Cellulomonas chitinilytica]GIG23286.1 putative ion-transport protein YfeO [Cellulomonas chitinilytica]
MTETATEFRVPVRRLLALTVPAAVVGVVCSVTLVGLSGLAGLLEDWLWDDLSGVFGLDRESPAWIVVILTLTGLLVGLVVRYVPGHAGPDPATAGLVEAPLRIGVVPGLALAMVLMLAGGVSLGPENPIMGINAALLVWFGGRWLRKIDAPLWVILSTAATLGAMFGTPLAAALMLTEIDPGDKRIPIWDRMFGPLVAATTGALTTMQLSPDLTFDIGLPGYDATSLGDMGLAVLLAIGASAVGVLAAYAFTPLHRFVHRVRNPVLLLTAGGLVLGVLGAAAGPITLFKGLEQMKELQGLMATTTGLGFLVFALVKLVALLVASSVGFRGGRIFPATFAGASLGFAVHGFWPSVDVTLAVGATTVGVLVAATRSGWLGLLLVIVMLPDRELFIPMLLATLAAWLVVTNRPELRAKDTETVPPPAPAETTAPVVEDAAVSPTPASPTPDGPPPGEPSPGDGTPRPA